MKYVIIGNSAAGIGAVEGIRQVDQDGEIIIITNEPHHTYSRPLISYLLLGKINIEKMKYRNENFYLDNNCTLIYADVIKIDEDEKQVVLKDSSRIPYDKLLVAAGSSAFVPLFDGLETVNNKYTFMSLDDACSLDAALDKDKRVLIIGAGLIGLKCAEGILERVSHITVLDLAPKILSSILDDGGAELVKNHLENKGIEFRLSAGIKYFNENCAVLEGGSEIAFDLLVLASGVRPNTVLLKGITEIDRGIVINEHSKTSTPDIYAAGDCTQTLDVSSGQSKIMALLPNAYMQGECAGINMAGGSKTVPKSFNKAIPMNAISFFGQHIITAGNYNGDIYAETENGNYKRLFYKDNRLNGYILIGNVEKAGIYTSLIRERTPLDAIDFELICKKPGLMAFTLEDRKIKLGEARYTPSPKDFQRIYAFSIGHQNSYTQTFDVRFQTQSALENIKVTEYKMNIAAKNLDFKELNECVKAAEDDVFIDDCYGQRFIGCGIRGKTISINGTPGNALGAYLDSGIIKVNGNVQDAVGDTMNDGRIIIHGNAGDALGYAMRGGEIFVRGDAGYRAGIHMKEYECKKPIIIIGGRAGSFLGEYLAGGLIIVLGIGSKDIPVGNFTGTGMHRGRIFIRTDKELSDLPEQVTADIASKEDMKEIIKLIQEFAGYFDIDADTLTKDRFYILKPNAKNPYKQLYTAN